MILYGPTEKYWGPYCPLPQGSRHYVHVIYPLRRGIVVSAGESRELADEELEAYAQQYRAMLARSLQEDWQR